MYLLRYGIPTTFKTFPAATPSANFDPGSMSRDDVADPDEDSADFAPPRTVSPASSATQPGMPVDPEPEPEPQPAELVDPCVVIPIAEIQGTGDVAPLAAQTVTTRGVVTVVYFTGGCNGYYLQTAGTVGQAADDTPGASDGIFVYTHDTADDVALGDHLQVTDATGKYNTLTQLIVGAGGLQVLDEDASAEPTALEFSLTEAAEAHRAC